MFRDNVVYYTHFCKKWAMEVNTSFYKELVSMLDEKRVKLVAVSKTKPISQLQELYNFGQRDFGENYVQELVEKQKQLPDDVNWHFIGHLQSNKVKFIASFVHLIHGVDSMNLLKEINKQAAKNNRIINCLLQIHIAQEETKFGFDANELKDQLQALHLLKNVAVIGLMGMASFSNDELQVRNEFKTLKKLLDECNQDATNPQLTTLSMGMSGDYTIAIQEGSNMVRIGSLLFGARG
jgi:PLP dependent protein